VDVELVVILMNMVIYIGMSIWLWRRVSWVRVLRFVSWVIDGFLCWFYF